MVTPQIKRIWGGGGGVHHRVERQILGKMPPQHTEETWQYNLLGGVMRVAGIEEIKTYTSRWQNIVTQYTATFPILYLCLDTERSTGSRAPTRWWDKEVVVFPGRPVKGWEGGDRGRDG